MESTLRRNRGEHNEKLFTVLSTCTRWGQRFLASSSVSLIAPKRAVVVPDIIRDGCKKGAETESRKRRKKIREGLCDCVWTEEGREKGGAKEMDGVGRNKKERGRGEDGVDEGRRRD
ncbi:hypothetical protein ACHWQZ_G010257 [Mnemiopsis leidyi]